MTSRPFVSLVGVVFYATQNRECEIEPLQPLLSSLHPSATSHTGSITTPGCSTMLRRMCRFDYCCVATENTELEAPFIAPSPVPWHATINIYRCRIHRALMIHLAYDAVYYIAPHVSFRLRLCVTAATTCTKTLSEKQRFLRPPRSLGMQY